MSPRSRLGWIVAGALVTTLDLGWASSALSATSVPLATVQLQVAAVGAPAAEVLTLPAAISACDGSVRLGDGSVRSCDGSVFVGRGVLVRDDFQASVELVFDSDPFIDFTVAVLNFTASPLSFVFTLGTLYSGGPYDTMTSHLDGLLTEARGDVVSASPLTLEGILDGSVIAALTISESCVADLGIDETAPCGPFGPLSAGVSAGATGTLEGRLSFTASPNNDRFEFAGTIELFASPSEVPAPASALLLGAALGGLALRRRG